MSLVIAPLRVDALVLEEPTDVAGADFDASRMPWASRSRDYNPDTPNLALAANAEPLTERLLRLSPGTHLHWAFPPGLMRGSSEPEPWRQADVNGLHFPELPTRWLIVRRRDEAMESAWLLESDYGLMEEGLINARDDGTDALNVAYPIDQTRVPGAPPFMRLGRSFEIPLDGPDPDLSYPPLAYTFPRLTAVGYGDPSFTALYANCRTVFGHRDPVPSTSGAVCYDVVGWYPRSAADPVHQFRLHADRTYLAGRDRREILEQLNRREGAALLAEDHVLSSEEIDDGIKLLLDNALGFRVDSTDFSGLICHGRVEIKPRAVAEGRPARIAAPVTIGNTSSEAVSALVAENCVGREDTARRLKVEQALEALRFAPRLRQNRLDIGTAFDEGRHAAGFRTVTEEKLWMVRPADGQTRKQDEYLLAPAHSSLVQRLNRAQARYDASRARLETLKRRLHCSWQSWMIARYRRSAVLPFGTNVDKLRILIARDCAAVEQARAETGKLVLHEPQNGHDSWTAEADGGMAAEVVQCLDALNAALLALAREKRHASRLVAARTPGRRFRQATDPALALSNPYVRPTIRHGKHGSADRGDPVTLRLFDKNPADTARQNGLFMRDLLTELRGGILATPPANAWTVQGVSSWTPFRLDWKASVRRIPDIETESGYLYDENYLTTTHELPESGHDLVLSQNATFAERSEMLTGRALLSGHAEFNLLRRIEEHLLSRSGDAARIVVAGYGALIDLQPGWMSLSAEELRSSLEQANILPALTDLAETFRLFWEQEKPETDHNADGGRAAAITACAAKEMPSLPLVQLLDAYLALAKAGLQPVTLPLAGLSEALAGRRKELHRPVADPLGFPADRALSDKVALALEGLHVPSPHPEQRRFAPIRGGEVSVELLRLIDGFGQSMDLVPNRVSAAEMMAAPGQPDRPVLSPRLAQPARVVFDWTPTSGRSLASDHPLATPVAGWLVLSHVDLGQIMVHDAEGMLLGIIGVDGRWRPAPGPRQAPDTPAAIAEAALAQVVSWIANREHGHVFTADFTRKLETALTRVHPEDADDAALSALLTGRPLCVARARVGIELLGNPLTSTSWTDLFTRFEGGAPSTHRFEHVRIPVRLGEDRRNADGLIGYWVDGATRDGRPGFVDDRFHVTGETGIDRLTVSCADGPRSVTMLLDPRGAVHMTTGILPTEAVRIEPMQYREALGRIGVTHLAAPVLTPVAGLELPLPPAPVDSSNPDIEEPQPGLVRRAPRARSSSFGHQSIALSTVPGTKIIETSFYFDAGDMPTFTLSGPIGAIDPVTGRITIPTTREISGVELRVTASNAIGSATVSGQVTVAAQGSAPVAPDADFPDPPARVDTPTGQPAAAGWTWIERSDDAWHETHVERRIDRAQVLAAFPEAGERLWSDLHQKGWVEPVAGAPDRPRLLQPGTQRSDETLGSFNAEQTQKVYAMLLAMASGIGRPSGEARYDRTYMLTEGWLQLRPHGNTK